MKRVAISGAAGFVGANLARRLLREGCEVHVLLRAERPSWRLSEIAADVRMCTADLRDRDAVQRAMQRIRPDCVFHLAVHGAYSWQTDVDEIVRTNVLGTINLVEACADAGVEVLVNTGSSSEYGYKDHAPSETELLEPNSHYAIAKATATMFCRFTALHRRMRVPTLRLYSAYGPFEEPRRLVPSLVVNGLRSRLPPLANPATARDYVHVDDVVEAYVLAANAPLEDPGRVFNVGTGAQTPLEEIVGMARKLLCIREEANWGSLPDRAWDTAIWRADPTRIRTELGWAPRFDIRAGLANTIEWFQGQPALTAFYEAQLS
jgi:nucleoside-diphosphate-sugar epimerase